MNAPQFSISVLAYQNIALTKKCIESVIAAGGDFELLLTDNGCQDGTGAYFDNLSGVRKQVFHYRTNLGFIEPNRRAFKAAKGKYVVLLNNDTVVKPNWLALLAAPFAADPKCALTGPTGGCCQLRDDFHGEVGPRFEYLEGAMLCMDRQKVAAIEPTLFPPELEGAYGEDAYLSLRMREMGYNLQRVAIEFTHYRCATSAMVPQCRDWQAKNHAFLRERFRFYIRAKHRFDFPTIVRRRAAWGDVLLTVPIIRGLKSLRPMSPIVVETECPDVFHGNPDVAHVVRAIPDQMGAVVVNLNGISEMNCGMPILDAYAQAAGIVLEDEVTKLYPPQGDVEWAKRVIPDDGWIAVGVGPTSWACKNWDMAKWKEVIALLRQQGHRIVLVGHGGIPAFEVDLDLRSKTNVMQLAALLGECRLYVGLDSFPLHAAQAMGTPVMGLFGITTPENILTRASPWRAARSDANHPGTGLRHRLPGKTHVDAQSNPMDTITVDQVRIAVNELLAAEVLG